MPLAIVACLALLLGVLAFVLDGGDKEAAAPALRPDSIARIAERVERERGLKFEHVPEPVEVTPARARREGLASLDTDYPPARRRADADVLVMLGLIPPDTDLGEAVGSTFGEAVSGYYDPREDRLRIVEGAQTANRVLYEMVLAHELTHALEDQRFEFDLDGLSAGGDRALAYTALIEGSASVLMYRYVNHRFDPEELFGGLAASAFGSTGDLPPFLTAQLLFSYSEGEKFVDAPARGRQRWLEGGRRRAALPASDLDRADPAPRRLPRRSSSRAASRSAGRCRRWDRAGGSPSARRSASGRPRSCSRAPAGPHPRAPPPAGAATATRCCAAATRARW